MASTASLLFNIAANADEAESTIKSFRALMSKDLGDLGGEFDEWSKEVFGDLSTVSGGLIGITAAIGAAAVAAVAFAADATRDYEQLADSVSHAMRVTGQSAEDMSVLHFAADETHVSFETLSGGLVRFETNVAKAAGGNKELTGAFQKLGISQADITDGQKNLMPLLGKVMDGFKGTASAVDRTALATALFSKRGPELMNYLMQGSGGLKEFADAAHRAGLIINQEAIDAFRNLQKAQETQKAIQEGVNAEIGKAAVPLETLHHHLMAVFGLSLKMNASSPMDWIYNLAAAERELGAVTEDVSKKVKAGMAALAAAGDDDPTKKIMKVKTAFYGISTILDELKGKIASFGDDNAKLAAEMNRYADQVSKARTELLALQKEGKITAESAQRESAALDEIPKMLTRLWHEEMDKQVAASTAAAQKRIAEQLAAEAGLRSRLAAMSDEGFEGQRAALEREVKAMRASYLERGQLPKEMFALIGAIYTAGMAKIDAAEKADADKKNAEVAAESDRLNQRFQQELSRLEEHQEQILAQHMTGQQKLELDYQKDLQKFSDVEEAKALKAAQGDAEIALVHQRYAAVRDSITTKYQQDLQTLQNSQGWQGVFGNKFVEMLKGNEALLKQWQQSANQSLLMVKVSLQDLKQMSQQAFEQFAQSMGSGAVAAAIQGKSIEAAMRQAVAATLESIASQAAVQAIYAAGLGFLDLAEQNYPGAEAAFTSAAIFGSVAAAATVGAKAITPSSATGAGGGGGASGSSGGSGGGGSANGAVAGSGASSQPQPYVHIEVQGNVYGPGGVQALVDQINQAVYGNNMQLYASSNKNGTALP